MLYVSPSQLERFSACERKWFYGYVLKLPQKEKKALNIGTAIDEAVGKWVSQGLMPQDPRAVAAIGALQELEVDKTWRTQVSIKTPLSKAVTLVGYADFLSPDKCVVLDLKTTKSERYIKTDFQLEEDIQLNTYAFCLKPAQALEVVVGHVVVLSEGPPKTTTTLVQRTHGQLSKFFSEKVEAVSENMVRASRLKVIDVPINESHCSAYGGCDYQEICLSERKGVVDMSGINSSGVLARLKARAANSAPAVSPPVDDDGFGGTSLNMPPKEEDIPGDASGVFEVPKAAPVVEAPAPKRGRPPKAPPVVEAPKATPVVEAPKATPVVEAPKAAPVVVNVPSAKEAADEPSFYRTTFIQDFVLRKAEHMDAEDAAAAVRLAAQVWDLISKA